MMVSFFSLDVGCTCERTGKLLVLAYCFQCTVPFFLVSHKKKQGGFYVPILYFFVIALIPFDLNFFGMGLNFLNVLIVFAPSLIVTDFLTLGGLLSVFQKDRLSLLPLGALPLRLGHDRECS